MNKRVRNILVALGVLALGVLSCRLTPAEPRELGLYPTATTNATQTPLVVVWTGTPNATYTPNAPTIIVLTQTPNSTSLCVSALVAVHLRPSPNADNYPITIIPNGTLLTDLGGKDGNWIFVQFGDKQGWVNMNYIGDCK